MPAFQAARGMQESANLAVRMIPQGRKRFGIFSLMRQRTSTAFPDRIMRREQTR
jgi:hypothetical protein